jgi:hypothetical protein
MWITLTRSRKRRSIAGNREENPESRGRNATCSTHRRLCVSRRGDRDCSGLCHNYERSGRSVTSNLDSYGSTAKARKIPITYEDPRYRNSADIEDVAARVARNLSPAVVKFGRRILVPRGKAISFVYSPQDLRTPEGAEATISRMLREYEALGGATFTITRDGGRFHVVPAKELEVTGERVSQASILDTVITVTPGQRDGGQLLHAICDEVRKQTGHEIGIGPSGPSNYLARYRTSKGIAEQSATEALENLLDTAAPRGSYVWDLYYAPGDRGYGLNVVYVGPAGPGHAGKQSPIAASN